MPDALCEIGLAAVSGGRTYQLNDVCGWLLESIEGLGVSAVARLAQRAPGQRGVTDQGFSQAARFITAVWINQGRNPADLWTVRAEMLSVFRPRLDDSATLQIYLPNGDLRAATVDLEGELDYRARDRADPLTWRCAVVLKAADWRLFEPIERRAVFNPLSGSVGWTIAESAGQVGWTVSEMKGVGTGWRVGQDSGDFIYTLVYDTVRSRLAAEEYPIIRVFGPIIAPTIINDTTNERLPFTNTPQLVLLAADFLEIDLRPGYKTATVWTGGLVSSAAEGYLATINDLATWHLSYNTERIATLGTRSDGDNKIRLAGSYANSTTRLEIIYYHRYLGA